MNLNCSKIESQAEDLVSAEMIFRAVRSLSARLFGVRAVENLLQDLIDDVTFEIHLRQVQRRHLGDEQAADVLTELDQASGGV